MRPPNATIQTPSVLFIIASILISPSLLAPVIIFSNKSAVPDVATSGQHWPGWRGDATRAEHRRPGPGRGQPAAAGQRLTSSSAASHGGQISFKFLHNLTICNILAT